MQLQLLIADLCLELHVTEPTFTALRQLDGLGPFVARGANGKALLIDNGQDAFPVRPHALFQAGPLLTTPPQNNGYQLLHTFDFEETDCAFFCCTDRAGYRFQMVPRNGSSPLSMDYCPEAPVPVITSSGTASPTLLRFALWIAYGLVAVTHHRIAIHSSVITYLTPQRKAVLFLGESGTGKSTHTRLWREHVPQSELLNDDSPILRFDPATGDVYVHGSPWSGKTPCYKQQCYPVQAIVRLSQAPFNAITPLSKLQAIGALYPSCPPAFLHHKVLQDKLLDIIGGVVQHVPVFHLECLPNTQAVDTVRKLLEATTR